MNEVYEVSPDCLIPRRETELLCELAINALPRGGRLLDLCCGSGCVAISALAARPDATGVGVELFPATAALARRNAERNGVADRLEIITADALTWQPDGLFGVITANPPYIAADEDDLPRPELFL